MNAALGVVPVAPDDVSAPSGSSALRLLAGRPLLWHAVRALAESGTVQRLLVAAPASLAAPIEAELRGPAVELLSWAVVAADLAGLAAAPELGAGDRVVVVHDPLHALAPAATVQEIVAVLRAEPAVAGVVAVRPVTDTLKAVDGADRVLATADREAYRVVCSPQAYRAGPLRAALRLARPGLIAPGLPALVRSAGGVITTVSAPQEVFRIAGAEELELASALIG
jgi:2-C-methyl-D-erythritol 4-phosphate cytidylyltransferase